MTYHEITVSWVGMTQFKVTYPFFFHALVWRHRARPYGTPYGGGGGDTRRADYSNHNFIIVSGLG
jgi:hypothetical protein